jgi:hypothetical protein
LPLSLVLHSRAGWANSPNGQSHGRFCKGRRQNGRPRPKCVVRATHLWFTTSARGIESRYEEHEFAQRYNKLVLALQSFSETYNSGHVIDVKRVKAIKKAWREQETSDWFKSDSTD